jgi:hypothetical protein
MITNSFGQVRMHSNLARRPSKVIQGSNRYVAFYQTRLLSLTGWQLVPQPQRRAALRLPPVG